MDDISRRGQLAQRISRTILRFFKQPLEVDPSVLDSHHAVDRHGLSALGAHAHVGKAAGIRQACRAHAEFDWFSRHENQTRLVPAVGLIRA